MNRLDNILQIITNPILKRAFLFLEEGNWEKANLYLEEVLNQNPEDGIAYLGKLMVDAQVHNCVEFLDLANPFENNINYQRCIRYADREIAKELSGYNGYIRERNNLVISESIYNDAVTLMNNAKTEVQFQEAANRFNEVSGYKDSTKLAAECLSKANEAVMIAAFRKADGLFQTAITSQNYREALSAFEEVADYYDVQKQIDECKQRIEETIRAEEEKEREREKRNAQIYKILKRVFAACVVMLLIGISGYFAYDKIFKYSSLETAKVGDLVKFGNFEKNDIVWKVLDVQGPRKLLISEYVLANRRIDPRKEYVEWEECELRYWLNNVFYKNSFNGDEKKRIKITNSSVRRSKTNSIQEYVELNDLVFLLSEDDLRKYYKSDSERACKGIEKKPELTNWWWTCTEDEHKNLYVYVDYQGCIRTDGTVQNDNMYMGVRPALWVDVKSESDDYNLFLEKEKARRDELERRENERKREIERQEEEKKIEQERLEQERKRELERIRQEEQERADANYRILLGKLEELEPMVRKKENLTKEIEDIDRELSKNRTNTNDLSREALGIRRKELSSQLMNVYVYLRDKNYDEILQRVNEYRKVHK